MLTILHLGDLWVNKDNVSFLQQLDLKKSPNKKIGTIIPIRHKWVNSTVKLFVVSITLSFVFRLGKSFRHFRRWFRHSKNWSTFPPPPFSPAETVPAPRGVLCPFPWCLISLSSSYPSLLISLSFSPSLSLSSNQTLWDSANQLLISKSDPNCWYWSIDTDRLFDSTAQQHNNRSDEIFQDCALRRATIAPFRQNGLETGRHKTTMTSSVDKESFSTETQNWAVLLWPSLCVYSSRFWYVAAESADVRTLEKKMGMKWRRSHSLYLSFSLSLSLSISLSLSLSPFLSLSLCISLSLFLYLHTYIYI